MSFIRALLLLFFSLSAASRRPTTNKLLKSKASSPSTKFESTTIVTATLEYKQKFGDLRIPVDYIVPVDSQWSQELWNFDLGAQAQRLRHRRNSRNSIPSYLKDSLDALGFVWDVRSTGFDEVYTALVRYKEIYGDLLVPQNFIVPQGEDHGFPQELWGLKLGLKVKSIRRADQYYNLNQSAMLDRLGFKWDYHEAKRDVIFQEDLDLLYTFKRIYGHVNIASDFLVPRNDSLWPRKSSGRPLGAIVNRIRKGMQYTTYAQQVELERLGVQISPLLPREQSFRDIYEALLMYKRLYGDLLVPRKFVVPEGAKEWPDYLWGMPLGVRVGSIRQGKSHSDIESTAMLDRIGFVWSLSEHKFDVFFKALKIYKKNYGNLYVPQKYIVSQDDASWPREFWGTRLGNLVQRARIDSESLDKDKKDKLKSLGFVWNARKEIYDFPSILKALNKYKEEYGSVDVPVHWTVPLDERWSAELWAMPLGLIVQNFRHRKTSVDLTQEKLLEHIGFVFKEDRKDRYNKETVKALEIFHSIHGHCVVPSDFQIPNDSSWPKELYDIALGSRVRAIRQRKIKLDRESVSKIEKIGFLFNPRRKGFEQLVYAANCYVEKTIERGGETPVSIPYSYVIPRDESWPKILHGFRLGPRLKYIRTRMNTIDPTSSQKGKAKNKASAGYRLLELSGIKLD